MSEQDKCIEINGIQYRVIAMLDEDAEETEEASEACFLLIQRPEDRRPAGTVQDYKCQRIKKGSLVKEATHS